MSETEKKERKIYKGEVKPAEALAKAMEGGLRSAPVQPIKRKYNAYGFEQSLPPSFVVTRFTSGYSGALTMHYYVPSTGLRAYREVPKDFELNHLSGSHAYKLLEEWNKAVEANLGQFTRRIMCTIGTDPEVFVEDGKGKVLPAFSFLSGKTAPSTYKTGDGAFNGTYYWDGFQAEFTTPGHITCLAQMSDTVQAGLKAILQAARAKNPKARLSHRSVVQVEDKVLASAAPEHVAFGCAPSKNIYGLTGNTKDGRETPYRFAGGHIHMGLRDLGGKVYGQARIESIVRTMDNILGVACVSLFANQDNPIRRQFYGQPGEHRLPAHGLEYRTLSNAWLLHPLLTNMVFDLARAAAGLVEEGFQDVWQATETETVETIMNHDVERARGILSRNKKVFKSVLQSIGGRYTGEALDVAYRVWSGGMEEAIANPEDIEGNWNLSGGWTSHNEGDGKYFGRALPKLAAKAKV